MKKSYKGFKLGDKVMTTKPLRNDIIHPKGTEFTIMSFPPCVVSRPGRPLYFIHGLTPGGKHVRAFDNEIKLSTHE